MTAPLPLRTARLTLANMSPADAPALRAIVTDPCVGRMLFLFPPDWSEAAARRFIDDTRFRGAPPFRLGLYRDDRLVGSVGVGPGEEPSIFYFLSPDAQGQGLAREAMRAFLGLLFDDLGVACVTGDVFADNPGSARILAGLGFSRVGAGRGASAARLEPAPISLYRLTADAFRAKQ